MAWLRTPARLHVRLYSLSITVLSPLLGTNILSGIPVNLACYLSILFLTLKLGAEVFDRRASLVATIAIAVWPSFLLHSTQLLKDLVFVTALLTLVLIMTWWLTRKFSCLSGLATGVAGGAASYVVSNTRSGFWLVILMAIVLAGTVLLITRQIRNGQALGWNVMSAVLIIIATTAVFIWAREQLIIIPPDNVQGEQQSLSMKANYVVRKISEIRQGFRPRNNIVGSEIDSDVEFATTLDLVRYLPRTAEIGFLAPFPNRWLTTGRITGKAGRLLSGIEMALFYLVEILALIGLWRSRSNSRAWLLCLVCLIGVGSLSLVVINLGALYRFRYGFFILLVILGAHGLVTSLGNWQAKTRVSEKAV
jgi:hypothetical protein